MTEPVRASDIESVNRELREQRAQVALRSSIIEATLQFAAIKAARQSVSPAQDAPAAKETP